MLPDIYFFNPTSEPAIANGSSYYTPSAKLRKFESDLSYLPGWLGREQDQVILHGAPDPDFEFKMAQQGFRLPRFLNLQQVMKDPEWIQMPKERLLPWGWSPAVCQLFKPAFSSFSEVFRHSVVAEWQPVHKMLYSRLTGIAIQRWILENYSADWLPDQSDIPVTGETLQQIYTAVDRYQQSVVKTPWSSSGRGLLLFPNPDSRKKNEELLSGMLRQQDFVTIEPWHEKLTDLSFQFEFCQGKLCYRGRTFFETDRKGRYKRTLLEDNPVLPEDVKSFLEEHTQKVVAMLSDALCQSDYSRLYNGWIGIDSMVYRSAGGGLKLWPVLEVNGRFTMGTLALKMREFLLPGSKGHLEIYHSKTIDFQAFGRKREREMPLVLTGNRMVSGFLPLTPMLSDHSFGACLEVVEEG